MRIAPADVIPSVRPVQRVLSLFLVLILVGGHVACLQVVAWAGMFANRVQTRTVAEALASTVDGSAPCAMCRAVKALQDDVAVKTPLKVEKAVKKADGVPTRPGVMEQLLVVAERGFPDAMRVPAGWSCAPDVPPPRG